MWVGPDQCKNVMCNNGFSGIFMWVGPDQCKNVMCNYGFSEGWEQ